MGDMVNTLATCMEQICISFGWRLEYLAIQPNYLQWSIILQPTTPPIYFMRTIRKQTSRVIFEEFPRFKRENRSDDFWAPGYMVTPGSRPHPIRVIDEFILATRQQQGIIHSHPSENST
jgi:REP element-mobilizing transposase RayT